MIFLALLKAFVLGVLVTAPVGPVGALVIGRALKRGVLLAFVTGLGAALADTLFACAAVLGLASVEVFIHTYERPIAFIGGAILVVVGAWAFFSSLRDQKHAGPELEVLEPSFEESEKTFASLPESKGRHLLHATAGSFLITLSNPVTIVGFAAAFTAFGFQAVPGTGLWLFRLVMVLGVLIGALSWWLFLSLLVNWMRKRMSKALLFKIHLGTHGLIFFSGLLCLVKAFWRISI